MGTQNNMNKKITDAFYHVLKTSSFAKAKVTNITQAAGISHQTFYRYFQDKYDLALKIAIDRFFAFHDIYSDNVTWKEIVIMILNSIRNYPVFFKKLLEDPEGTDIVLQSIIAVTEKFSAKKVSRHSVAVWISIFKEWSNDDFKAPVDEIYQMIKTYTPLKEVLSKAEIEQLMTVYENHPLAYFRNQEETAGPARHG